MIEISLSIYGLDMLLENEIHPVLEVARLVDESTIDTLVVTDHVVMGINTAAYPYGDFPTPPDAYWWEPMTLLSHIAAFTSRVQLATGILIAPLRPTALLAKQCTTLDQLSRGRLVLGVGAGWQREEFEACGVNFDDRFNLLWQQMRACKSLWEELPASYESELVKFDQIYCRPGPYRESSIPVWFGVKVTPASARRLAELGQGWLPIVSMAEAELTDSIATLKRAYPKVGRDPAELRVKVSLYPHWLEDGTPCAERTLEDMRRLSTLGVTDFEFNSYMFVKAAGFIPHFLDWLDTVRAEINR